MADHQNAALIDAQRPFQLCLGVRVQMVGGLIQQKHVGRAVDQLAEPHLRLFAAAQHPDQAFDVFGGQAAFCQSGAHLILGVGGKGVPDFLDAGGIVIRLHFLLKVSDAQIIPLFHAAGKRRNQAQNAF